MPISEIVALRDEVKAIQAAADAIHTDERSRRLGEVAERLLAWVS